MANRRHQAVAPRLAPEKGRPSVTVLGVHAQRAGVDGTAADIINLRLGWRALQLGGARFSGKLDMVRIETISAIVAKSV